jgi:type VI secretion system protein ImpE
MTALELFHDGRLSEAVIFQHGLVQDEPGNASARLLLIELQLFAGQFQALRQNLGELARVLPEMDEYVRAFHLLLDAEEKRQRLPMEGEPVFLRDPPDHIAFRLDALHSLRQESPRIAMNWLDEADARAPWVRGRIDGREFDGARDCDDLLGPVLELLIDDQYAWFPCEEIQRLRIGKVLSLRDFYFVPAQLTTTTGDEWRLHLPALYAGTHRNADDRLRAGWESDWEAEQDGPIRGVGQRILRFGEEELSLREFSMWEA